MRRLALILLALCLAGSALAVEDPTSNRWDSNVIKGQGDGASTPRTGGDTIADATVIPSLPYTDTGATCGYAHDYTDCVYNAGAPDVVYAYTPSADGGMNVSLCGSGYDTALWVYAGGVGNTVGCNDDFCGYQSEVDNIDMTAGITYYIVISGFSSACGSYLLNVTPAPCTMECPPGGVPEGEPACYDGYQDTYNGGCTGDGWTLVPGPEIICGLSGTYLVNGDSFRDTDWYDAVGVGGPATLTCTAEFPLRILFIYAPSGMISCSNYSYDFASAPRCLEASLTRTIAEGAHFWPWVAPSAFAGIDCGSRYVLEIAGVSSLLGACCIGADCMMTMQADCAGAWQGSGSTCEPDPCLVPAEQTTWGAVKHRYGR